MLVCLRPKMRKVLIFVSATTGTSCAWCSLIAFEHIFFCLGQHFVTNCKLISYFALQALHTYIATLYQISCLEVFKVNKLIVPSGLICILDIDIQGVKSIKETDISCNYIFVQPPSMEILKQRLQGRRSLIISTTRIETWGTVKTCLGRGTETEESLEKRLSQGAADMQWVSISSPLQYRDIFVISVKDKNHLESSPHS